MAELLLELFSEEIPARMQLKAADELKAAMETAFKERALDFTSVQTFVTPRRLVCVVDGLARQTKKSTEERRGPRVNAPEAAMAGFLKSAGVTQDQCLQKGDYWYVIITQNAQATADLIPDLVRGIIRSFSWATSMRWPGATLTWVRPVRSLLCLLDGKTIFFDVPEFGITASNKTYGHRFLAPEELMVHSFTDYQEKLAKAYVVLDHVQRQHRIEEKLIALAQEKECVLEPDKELLQEVAGLTEYPKAMLGTINKEFMRLPKPVLSTSMRVHQKYFTFVDKAGNIAPYFGFAANTVPPDGGKDMLRGYERVLRARLSDAAFFYDQDCKSALGTLVPKLDKITFHAKLGTLGQRIQRFAALVDSAEAKRAAILCKADLVTSMVGEFPELQGIMGGIYARVQGETESIAQAIEEHYQPVGASDSFPQNTAAIELALADKMDALVGFFGIGERPTGSKDPFALRRAALGIIRIIRENHLKDYDLREKLNLAAMLYTQQNIVFAKGFQVDQVVDFILERLAHALRAAGIRHDCIAAVLEAEHRDENICSLAERAASLHQFLESESGTSLQAAFRRAQGILAKSEIDLSNHQIVALQLFDPAEKKLLSQLDQLAHQAPVLLQKGQYLELMQLLSELRPVVDDFFTLKINDDVETVRLNRFALLQQLIDQTRKVADFSKLEG
ncbi:glycine--tRNA ligase subunit beta [Candidatus Paracaedibacter symbiosus]|uniref:glycine--tRNA ligase subunit beta n=1 Tax=Candidatus Paracaedibacter symbiosus TaxID=244582 RepID=UPI000509C4D1|nr:glycine--tRNA ligase subunit beta [Candidatus Paracaedibacter symbiosus]